jgi:thiol-disulfide isomerase/thioredoxin
MTKKRLTVAIVLIVTLCVLMTVAVGFLVWQLFILEKYEDKSMEMNVSRSTFVETARDPAAPEKNALYSRIYGALTDERGNFLDISDLLGKPALLFFWSSWCGDCKAFFDDGFSRMTEAAKITGMPVLLICREGIRGDNVVSARKALADHSISMPLYMDSDAMIYKQTGLNEVPGIAVLNADGLLVYTSSDMPDADQVNSMYEYASQGPTAQTDTLLRSMIKQDGSLSSGFSITGLELIQTTTYLSETQGLIMQYALLDSNARLFDSAYSYAKETLDKNNLFSWQHNKGRKERVNASLDDLRMISLLTAAANDRYKAEARDRAAALYDAAVRNGVMRDFVDLDSSKVTNQVTLCYQDITAMKAAAYVDVRWLEVAESAEMILAGGLISEEFPLYYPAYDADSKQYIRKSLQMNEAMLTVLNAARAGIIETKTLDWLEKTLNQGPLYAAYQVDGTVVEGYRFESTATYALIVQTGIIVDRPELTRLALSRMESIRCFEPPYVGGYGQITDEYHYSFDILQAAIALKHLSLEDLETK